MKRKLFNLAVTYDFVLFFAVQQVILAAAIYYLEK